MNELRTYWRDILGFFGRFIQPKATLTLKTDKREFAFGEEVKGFAEVESEEEFDIEWIGVYVDCIESVKKTRNRSFTDGAGHQHSRQEDYWDTAKLSSYSAKACGEMHITQGFFLGFPFAIKLPATGRETYRSVDQNLQWSLWTYMKNKKRPSLEMKYEITVTKPSTQPVAMHTEKEIVRELVLIPCAYCGGLMPQTSLFCPNCGARRKA